MSLVFALLIPFLAAPPTATSQPTTVTSQPTNMAKSNTVHRGAPFELTKEVTLDEIMAAPEKYGKSVRITEP